MTAPESVTETATLPLIDLNKDRREERRQVFRRSQRHGLALLALTIAAGAILVPLTLQVAALRRALRKTEGHAREERDRLRSVTAASTQLDGQIGLWERLKQTQLSRRVWGATFPSLAACLPEDVFLQQVQIGTQDNDAEIHLQGSARTMAGLRTFTTALEESPMFARIHLDDATTDTSAGHKSLSFHLTGPITTGATSAAP